MSKTIKRTVADIIDFSKSKTNSSKFTKTFIQDHKGCVPVYGASLVEDDVGYGYVADNLPDVRYFDNCLTWNIDGSTGIFFREGHFSLSEKVIPLIVFEKIKDKIDLIFLKYSIMFSKEFKEFGFSNKAGKRKLGEIEINIPILPNGEYDLQTQKELAKQYRDIERQKNILLNKIEELKKTKILIESDETIRYEEVPIIKLFTPKGGDMKLSKPYCKEHSGDFPVYSGSTTREIFGSIDTFKYDGEYLTWVIDGLAGYVMKIKGKFSITCHRGILIPTEECKNVDLLYVKYMIEPMFRKRARGRIGINGKNEYTALKPTHIINYNDSIFIPVDEDGAYDLKRQQELAQKYATIESIKEKIYNQVNALTNIVVD